MVWPPPCTGGNKAHDISVESLIVKTAGSGPGEAYWKAHRRTTYAWGRPRVFTELPDRELGLCEEFLARGSNED